MVFKKFQETPRNCIADHLFAAVAAQNNRTLFKMRSAAKKFATLRSFQNFQNNFLNIFCQKILSDLKMEFKGTCKKVLIECH